MPAQFAKLFDFDGHQMLVTKEENEDDSNEEIHQIHFRCENGMQVVNAVKYDSAELRDSKFAALTEESARPMFETVRRTMKAFGDD